MSGVTYGDVLRPDSALGDETITVPPLTVRQVAAFALLLGNVQSAGLDDATYLRLATEDEVAARGWAIALGELTALLGRPLAKALGDASMFAGLLAELDQTKAEWRDS